MTEKIKVSAIVCAAGKGLRAEFGRNKNLLPLCGAPVLYHTLRQFDIPEIDEVIVTSSELDFEEISAVCAKFGFKVVVGGETRTESVKRALNEVTGEIVLIHDGARPYVKKRLILDCIDSVKAHGSAVPAVSAADTAVYADGGKIVSRLERDRLRLVQTPQGFFTEDVKRAYDAAGDKIYTDDSAVYGEFIRSPHVIDGDRENVKLTYRSDFLREYPTLCAGEGQRVGFGVDVHPFGEGNYVTLCGVKIDCDAKLVAHSDGDAVFHAVTDALLSAAGLKDIGHYFPDTDPELKGADSGKLLGETVRIVKEHGFSPINVSVSVQAEKPRLAPHIDGMIANLSERLGIAPENVAVAAGTSERLGFVGEGLGIAAYCTLLLKKN